ncbi:helix-turn-helix transcriptional regulator [Actinomadura viridis]|uniref:Transcriptional regulator with XRE-family HTH domain n=1 Tax=Actinomadura viridis TaxID=58110 RepID=A0A931DJA7_9ACTN|nr:helix-turn-helix transcriptional regulator [Actinomadura viridis]MBG6090442.1 transcriptional regulator with XRE-family HTH domain [Actinomadura viridis]
MSSSTPLGEFLRARREGLKPQDVGLPEYGRRRVKGLRREEVALLAGMSSDYYVRLEQGRESSPSPQVIEAVARALLLDGEAADHLRRLAQPRELRFRRHVQEQVSPQLVQLMDGFAHSPAFALGPALDILAGNAMADALHEAFSPADNLARMVFCDPAGREFYQEWERAAHSCVAELRAAYGHDPDNARIAEVVADLSAQSPEFADLWGRHDVKSKSQEGKLLRHRRVGDLHIQFSALTVNGAPHQQLVVYQAEPASPTAIAFQRLAGRAGAPRAQGVTAG